MRFGIVADDQTGATDAASMLTDRGVRTMFFLQPPDPSHLRELSGRYDAAVVGTSARSAAPQEAFRRSYVATGLLAQANVEKFQVKYCSTFDSTPKGNIGQSLDAAMEVLRTRVTVVAPALPVNGRTTYCGYHFVDGRLLSESPLKDHPLNPMTDPDLVRWLQRQTERPVANVGLPEVRGGKEALRRRLEEEADRGRAYLVTDAIEQNDLRIVAEATADWRLISGGSGIAAEIPAILFPNRAPLSFDDRLHHLPGGTLAVAGSCSPATRAQNESAEHNGFAVLALDGIGVVREARDLDALARQAAERLAAGENVLLSASAGPEDVALVHQAGKEKGLSKAETGDRIAKALAIVCAGALNGAPVGRLVVSGGETASAVCVELGIAALEVGLSIEPGIPYCFPESRADLAVILKSGNFGSEDFYLRVADL